MEQTIKVFIVDDHEIFRNGLKLVFSKNKETEVTGEAGSGEEFLQLMDSSDFDVVLMDIKMKGLDGIETTAKAVEKNPGIKVLVLSTFGEEEFLHQIINAGAKGFLLKNVDKETLFNAIKLVHNGQNYFSPELLPYFTNKFLDNKNDSPELLLTKRELEILQLIAEGYSNAEIADKLFISIRTVDTHKNNLISKTGSKNVVSLLIYAIKNKIISIEN
ncbi:MAG: response regulator transcription factor [Bacteroidales bacterium]|nr:response regulator transcription factor [Bacteroidales bacterium]